MKSILIMHHDFNHFLNDVTGLPSDFSTNISMDTALLNAFAWPLVYMNTTELLDWEQVFTVLMLHLLDMNRLFYYKSYFSRTSYL